MESTPDSGVAIRKAVVAPLLAPCLLSDAAAGSTPHDQSGSGTPNRAALSTEENLPRPRWLAMVPGLRITLTSPATRMPMRIYTEESRRIPQAAAIISAANRQISAAIFSISRISDPNIQGLKLFLCRFPQVFERQGNQFSHMPICETVIQNRSLPPVGHQAEGA